MKSFGTVMKVVGVIVILLMLAVSLGALVSPDLFAEEVVPIPAPAPVVEGGSAIWNFLNSDIGMMVVGFILTLILGKIFTTKPAWKVYVDKYKPMLMTAVKNAEKAIPDKSPNAGAKRLDIALKYMLSLDAKLNPQTLTDAINEVHAEAEANDNI